MDRREAIKNLGLGLTGLSAGALSDFSQKEQRTNNTFNKATSGLPDLKITSVKAIAVQPGNVELVVVKVETSEPGLYGLGCATFRQRAHSVVTAIDKYLNDFCVGKSVNNIEDMWQMAYQSSYWRNGPVLNNALSGLDQALWDIKGKRANMPLYELFGGKCRFACNTYSTAGGSSIEQVVVNSHRRIEEGYRNFRLQLGGYSGAGGEENPDFKVAGFGHEREIYMDRKAYIKGTIDSFEAVRIACGDEIELMHDVHSRIQPMDAINMCKALEQYNPYFIEDPLSPENNDYFELMRQHTTVPIAMGELFNNPHEWVGPMSKRWFDFIRIHISQIGGITPALKVARLGEWFNVLTAWHGPPDTSPIGHACNAHISLSVWNFGIQEYARPNELVREIFPGTPTWENGYMYVNEVPGHGVDINEVLAARYPIQDVQLNTWTQIRSLDGTPIRP